MYAKSGNTRQYRDAINKLIKTVNDKDAFLEKLAEVCAAYQVQAPISLIEDEKPGFHQSAMFFLNAALGAKKEEK